MKPNPGQSEERTCPKCNQLVPAKLVEHSIDGPYKSKAEGSHYEFLPHPCVETKP